ncbi:MAG: erythromycin esterase family protein [Gemmatimonadaceae bacterium]|nr:erythromycin esterase family protein [Gemmatimonadaceae bacterium]
MSGAFVVLRLRGTSSRTLAAGLMAAALAGCSADESTGTTPEPPSEARADFRPGIPQGWTGGTARADQYEIGLDVGVKRQGNGAAYLRSRTTTQGTESFAAVNQALNAAPYRGKRVRFSGWVQADSIISGAGLWMRIDGATRQVGFDNMLISRRPIVGTATWHQVSVVLDVPQEAISLTLGALITGRGTLRVDDVTLDTVALTTPVTAGPSLIPYDRDSSAAVTTALRYPVTISNADFEGVSSMPATTAAWLAANAVPFNTDAAGSGLDDLAELGRIVGSARIIGFGEATHGTREFFRMKHRAFEYLVERHGVNWFTIEATMSESRDVDHYITHGVGDPRALLSRLQFWTWNTQEVLDLIRWMRDYNVRVGSPRLRFFGFDMQSADVSVDSVRSITTRIDGPLAERAIRIVGCFDAARDPRTRRISSTLYLSSLSVATRTLCQDSVTALRTAIQSSRTALLARSDAETVDWLQQYTTQLIQWTQMAGAPNTSASSLIRDQAMADNLAWAVNRAPGSKHFAWAHNYHVSRRPNTMGYHLGRQFGNDYRVFGFTFGTGQFNAYEQVGTTVTSLKAHTITSIDTTAIEYLFQQVNRPRLLLDTRKILDGGAATAPLRNGALRMRTIGALYNNAVPSIYFEDVLLPADYDGIIWFSTTSASFLLPFQ